jgi:hypothetical protein
VDEPAYVSGDDGNGVLDVGETWFYEAGGIATTGLYQNVGSVDAEGPQGQPTSDSDESSYYGANPLIDVEKLVFDTYKGEFVDADTAPGALVAEGSDPLFRFEVSNIGNVDFDSFTLADSQGLTPSYESGDDGDNVLEVGETWIYSATGTWEQGQQTNTATVTGSYEDDLGSTASPSDTDDANYFGIENPGNQRSLSVDMPRDARDGIKNGVFLDSDDDFHGWASLTNQSNDGTAKGDPLVNEYVTTLAWSFEEDTNPSPRAEDWSLIAENEYVLNDLWYDTNANGLRDVGEDSIDYELFADADANRLTISTFIEVEDTVNIGFEFEFVNDVPDPLRVTLYAEDFQGRDFQETEVYSDFDVLI